MPLGWFAWATRYAGRINASSPFEHRLLLHLESVGYAGEPRYLGRDVLGYISGWVPARFKRFANGPNRMLLRSFHDATRGSGLTGAHQVMFHDDPGPNNVMFQHGRPVAFIDFDFPRTCTILEDVGYLASTWHVVKSGARSPPDLRLRNSRFSRMHKVRSRAIARQSSP